VFSHKSDFHWAQIATHDTLISIHIAIRSGVSAAGGLFCVAARQSSFYWELVPFAHAGNAIASRGFCALLEHDVRLGVADSERD
jgi:hypothetical protein